jgi:protein ImuB
VAAPEGSRAAIAPPGGTRAALEPLPVAALRIDPETVAGLSRVGLRRIADLLPMPRAALARRFGTTLVRRLDQALGAEPEPISPTPPPPRLAVRLTFPEPVGLEADMRAALDRLLPALCARLEERGLAARRIRLEARRSEGCAQRVEARPARPSADPGRIGPLLAMRLEEIEAGFGIDAVRLEALDVEPVAGAPAGEIRAPAASSRDLPFVDLVGRIGARLGLEAVWRVQPAESHIPEKTHRTVYVAWSEPHEGWPALGPPRPLLLWPPEAVPGAGPAMPAEFRWRGRTLEVLAASEPERIAPEWWLDDHEWRSGTRDYRRVTMRSGEALWLFYAHGGQASPGWFCQGRFA